MVEIDELTLFEILVGVILAIIIPVFVYFWRQNTQQTKFQAEQIARTKLIEQKVDNLIELFGREVAKSEKQHERMESKIDDLCDRTARLETRKT